MALKFGRTSRNTSSILPDGRIRYSQAEYDANVEAIASEASRKKDYDASVDKFKTDSDAYYGRNAIDAKKSSEGAAMVNMQGNKDRQGRVVTGEVAKDQTQYEIDTIVGKRLKKGEIVSINDPSVTAKTRELLTASNKGTDISKGYIEKGKNFTSFDQIYGEKFSPIEWEKSARAHRLDEDGYGGRSYSPIDEAGVSRIVGAPVKPGAYVPNNVKPIDLKNSVVDWKDDGVRLKPLEVKFGGGELRRGTEAPKAKEKEEFVGPEKIMEVNKKVSMNPLAGGATSQGSTKRYINQVNKSVGSRIKNAFSNPNRRYNKEEKGFKSLYGGGATIGDEGFADKSFDELKDYKKEVRGAKRRGVYEKGDANVALGEIRSAIKFTRAERNGKNEFFESAFKNLNSSAGMGKRYAESSTYETDRKSSMDNAANRNTISNQQTINAAAAAPTSSFSSSVVTRGQMKDKFATANPTASKQEIRQGVRLEADANRKLIKDVVAKQKANQ